MRAGGVMEDTELTFPCASCGQTIRTGIMVELGTTDSSVVGTPVECTHCGAMNEIELDHIWRARQKAMEARTQGKH